MLKKNEINKEFIDEKSSKLLNKKYIKDKEVMTAFNKAVLSKFKISLEGFFRVLDHNYEQ